MALHGTLHPRFVRGCDHCLQRTKAAQRRYTESKQRMREGLRARCNHVWYDVDMQGSRVCTKCYQREVTPHGS